MEAVRDRAAFERLVAATARRPLTNGEIAAELERQTLYHPEPDGSGLDELAGLLRRRFVDEDPRLDARIEDLERAFARQPLVHLYGFALRREGGQVAAARRSLDALLEIDPGDPMAAYFDAFLRSQPVVSASEEARIANIAKFASTPLLKNPYSLAVRVLFEAIRGCSRARVLDVGVGSGAQMEALLAVEGAAGALRLRGPRRRSTLPQHAAEPGHAAVAEEGWYRETSDYDGTAPIALLVASPS